MAITVNTNVFSLSAQRNVNRTQGTLQEAMSRLSSGLRVNQAKDDAAGLAVAMRMETQARGSMVAQRNIQDGLSALQVGDNTLRDVNDMLQRMRELATQSMNGTYATSDRAMMDLEFQQLKSEIGATMTRGKFNNKVVLSDMLNGLQIMAGANSSDLMTIDAQVTQASIKDAVTVGVDTSDNAATALGNIDTALNAVASGLARIGSFQSRLEKALSSAMAVEEAQWASRGRIMDADFARETSRLTNAQIIQQAGVSALAQANTIPQLALGLLG